MLGRLRDPLDLVRVTGRLGLHLSQAAKTVLDCEYIHFRFL